MAAVNFQLRGYQTNALNALRAYLRRVNRESDNTNPAEAAFLLQTKSPYATAPEVGIGVPYICIRIPTGGGKTILAAHAVGVAAKEYLQTDNPMVLWLVPSTAILDQTLGALRNEDHPYRAALAADFGRNVSVLSVTEALSLSRADATGGACIIVGTIQAFRRDDTTGLNVFKSNGSLMDHFSALDPSQAARLDKIEGGDTVAYTLANLLRLHRPMVIVDEAHNARTELSFKTLAAFDPSIILEMTATPQTKSDPDKGEYPSNVLFHVSAAELKAEDMVKLPIRLNTDRDWLQVIGQARDCRAMLEEAAKTERAETGEYIRPIILFQAQSKLATDPDRLTIEKVYGALREAGVPEDQIARHGGGYKELDAIADIASEDCAVRYVITMQALREGWDCPFAYVLCSVAALTSATAVEQILGRVLRMPKAKRKTQDVLNRAYAFVTSDSFQETAEKLKDGLVDGAGFNRMEVKELVKQFELADITATQTPFTYTSDALPEEATATVEVVESALAKLPPKLKDRVSFTPDSRTFKVSGTLSSQDRTVLQLAFAPVRGADRIIDRLYRKSNRIMDSELPADLPPFIVPRLAIRHQGALELFSQDHFLDLPWNLADCDPAPFAERFNIDAKTMTGEIDVTDKGAMKIDYIGQLHDQLALAIQEPAWTVPRLVNWIDRGIKHEDVTKPAARIFIHRALGAVMARKGYTLDQLARYKYEVRRVMAEEIQKHREKREIGAFAALFPARADQFVTSAEIEPLLFDEAKYAPTTIFNNQAGTFKKHYFAQIGDMKDRGEEYDCALHIDRHPKIEFWVRNLVRKPNAFWLQTSQDKFFPDFVARLKDGRILVVEYKGKTFAQLASEKDKEIVGKTWAEASGGTCLFVMPIARDFAAIDRVID
jgi:type III restriction enzyme